MVEMDCELESTISKSPKKSYTHENLMPRSVVSDKSPETLVSKRTKREDHANKPNHTDSSGKPPWLVLLFQTKISMDQQRDEEPNTQLSANLG